MHGGQLIRNAIPVPSKFVGSCHKLSQGTAMLRIKSPDVQAYFEVLGLDVDDVSRRPSWGFVSQRTVRPLLDTWKPSTNQMPEGCWDQDEHGGKPELQRLWVKTSGSKVGRTPRAES